MKYEKEESLGYDNREPKGQAEYAKGQHDLCCQELGLEPRHDREGDTLLEAITALKKDRDEWKEEAGLRMGENKFLHNEINLLRAELKKADEALEANITTFIDLREGRDEARACAVELRESLCRPEWAKPIVFPWEKAAPGLDSENADVDLPDTAAQDSASKSNNPAVSG